MKKMETKIEVFVMTCSNKIKGNFIEWDFLHIKTKQVDILISKNQALQILAIP